MKMKITLLLLAILLSFGIYREFIGNPSGILSIQPPMTKGEYDQRLRAHISVSQKNYGDSTEQLTANQLQRKLLGEWERWLVGDETDTPEPVVSPLHIKEYFDENTEYYKSDQDPVSSQAYKIEAASTDIKSRTMGFDDDSGWHTVTFSKDFKTMTFTIYDATWTFKRVSNRRVP